MKKYTLYIVLICCCFFGKVKGQVNLVPNGGFEDTVHCPNDVMQINYTFYWSGIGTSDYYNSCSGVSRVGVPRNCGGFQYARTGNAYAGFYTYFAAGSNLREYVQVKLDSVLKPMHKYCAEFYVSLADTQKIACNNMGIYFSDTAISNHPPLYNFTPQITNDITTNPLTDKIGWTKVSGSFIATGGEYYIIIGNYINDANSSHITLTTGNQLNTYYYIDDVSVVDCTYAGITEINNPNSEILISPNPTTGVFTIHTAGAAIKEIKITNVLGETITNYELRITNETTVDLSNEAKGIYFVQITVDSAGSPTYKNVVNRKIIKY